MVVAFKTERKYSGILIKLTPRDSKKSVEFIHFREGKMEKRTELLHDVDFKLDLTRVLTSHRFHSTLYTVPFGSQPVQSNARKVWYMYFK